MRVLSVGEYLRQVASQDEATGPDPTVSERVERILAAVRQRGDEAVMEYTETLDGVRPKDVRVPKDALERAWRKTPPELQKALTGAARNITTFQRRLKPKNLTVETRPGVKLTVAWRPMGRVLCYAPGGRASYPSTVLMTVVPATVAGVQEVYVASPPQPDGAPSVLVLAAAHLAKATAVYAVGGAQAVGAFAYGTQTIPRVDKVVGPGNAYVVEAKRQLVGTVGIDGLAGPSELVVVADPSADPALVAVDLAAQAEHDPQARALVVVPSTAFAQKVEAACLAYAGTSDRRAILEESLSAQGLIVVASGFEDQLKVVEAAAPEHVQLMVRSPARYTQRLRAAGTVFEGVGTPAPLGDYVTGANHVLPTGRTARWSGPLGVHDFLKPMVVQRATQAGLRGVGPAAVELARAEGLPAHAESIARRLRP